MSQRQRQWQAERDRVCGREMAWVAAAAINSTQLSSRCRHCANKMQKLTTKEVSLELEGLVNTLYQLQDYKHKLLIEIDP